MCIAFGARVKVSAHLLFVYDLVTGEGSKKDAFDEPPAREGRFSKRCYRIETPPRTGIVLAKRRRAIGWHNPGRAPASLWDDDVYMPTFLAYRYITAYEIRFPEDYESYWVLPEDVEAC